NDAPVPNLDRVERGVVTRSGPDACLGIEPELIEVAVLAGAWVVDLENVRTAGESSSVGENVRGQAIADGWRAVSRFVRLRLDRKDVRVTEGLLARVARQFVARDLDEKARETELLHDGIEVGDRIVLGGDRDLDSFRGVRENSVARRHRRIGAEDRMLVK